MTLSKESKVRIREAVATAGLELESVLKPVEGHPKRNAYAHLWKEIKSFYGHGYAECDESQVEEILGIIEWARKNPDVFMVRCGHCGEFSAHQPYDPWTCPHCNKSNIVPSRK